MDNFDIPNFELIIKKYKRKLKIFLAIYISILALFVVGIAVFFFMSWQMGLILFVIDMIIGMITNHYLQKLKRPGMWNND
jgi:ABC-type multidrug transport system fused ATPase/permease subunit